MKISLIIPAHNEEGLISETIEQIEKGLSLDYEIIVVNDHSGDHTKDKVNQLRGKYKNIILVDNPLDGCFANALMTGFKNASGDYLVPVMADLCDEIKTIEAMAKEAEKGFDVIVGSRYMKGGRKIGGPLLKSLFSKGYGGSLNFLIRIPTVDVANAFKMYRRKMLEDLELESKWFDISVEIALKAFFKGYKITEVPTTWRDRKSGESKFNMRKIGGNYVKLYWWALKNAFCNRPSL